MQNHHRPFAHLTNEQLLLEVKTLASGERHATAQLIASLAELDMRELYLAEGFPSLFAYCTQVLHLSEGGAYNRIQAARAARQWPIILEKIADGSVTLTAVRLLGKWLTDANHRQLLEAVTHKTKREVEELVAALDPKPAARSLIRQLPALKPDVPSASLACPLLAFPATAVDSPSPDSAPTPAPLPPPLRRSAVTPLAPERYKVQFTVSRETHDKLRRLQDLMRHQAPDGDLAIIFDRAVTLLLHDIERKTLAHASRPRPARPATPGSRHVPAAVRREVWMRDAGQCAFAGNGRRCTERGFLEFHHVVPFADGGSATSENIQLRCRAHNRYEAEEYFRVASLAHS
jgi:hypothetical protein